MSKPPKEMWVERTVSIIKWVTEHKPFIGGSDHWDHYVLAAPAKPRKLTLKEAEAQLLALMAKLPTTSKLQFSKNFAQTVGKLASEITANRTAKPRKRKKGKVKK